MPKKYICSDCRKEFSNREKGCKLVSSPFNPRPLCPKCNSLNRTVSCENCNKTFKLKEGGLDECWECRTKGCSFCLKEVTIRGMSFYFCNLHLDYNKKGLEEEALEIEEEARENVYAEIANTEKE